MIEWTQALSLLMEEAREGRRPIEEVSLATSLHTVLAEQVASPMDQPAFDQTAMDGFAVRLPAAGDKSSATFNLVQGVQAAGGGEKEIALEGGQAMRIMTGGEIPEGANAIVPFEQVLNTPQAERDGFIEVSSSPRIGEHIRVRGEDISQGQVVFTQGQRVTPYVMGLLANLGQAKVSVRRSPRIMILPTGSELVEHDGPALKGKIFNGNGPMVWAACLRDGFFASRAPAIGDDRGDLTEALSRAIENTDLLLTIGGVSKGDFDYLPEVIEKLGGEVLFHRIAIRPGKPLLFARIQAEGKPTKWIFSLPGNPVASAVTFEVFVKPFLLELMGESGAEGLPPRIRARLAKGNGVTTKRELTFFMRARWTSTENGNEVETFSSQGSHMMSAMTKANGLMIVPSGTERVEAGESVDVIPLGYQGNMPKVA